MKARKLKVKLTKEETTVKINIIMLVVLAITVVLIILAPIVNLDYKLRFGDIPEQIEQAEVVDKEQIRSGKKGARWVDYVITFRFSDGSEKKFIVSSNARRVYNLIEIGETGKLTYKEIESNDGDESFRSNRRFISFEKDPKYGGETIKPNAVEATGWNAVIFFFTPWLVISIILSCLGIKRNIGFLKASKQVIHVKVIRKRTQDYKGKKTNGCICTNYFVTFVLPDGSKKEFMTGRNNSKFYCFVNEGDTGTFTYKEYNNKTISFSFKKDT